MRNKVTFHYDANFLCKALKTMAQKNGDRSAAMTLGREIHHWHFEIADWLVDQIVVRQIWNIPQDRDLRTEADTIAVRLTEVRAAFVEFAGHFIRKQTDK